MAAQTIAQAAGIGAFFDERIFQAGHDHQNAHALCIPRTVPQRKNNKYRLTSMRYDIE
ncbi:hypothetical protein [Polaromonas sp.]|uniref:hypothetical protein n=1 Tax=Polaromonas sp. TaxID=1869339 RepID=UPI0013B69774|nr:hypothetical protein [Polaromonas sp.]NDP61221.1 hypothetical protein [Polaromonas sp.]